jgi:hypothetical protein
MGLSAELAKRDAAGHVQVTSTSIPEQGPNPCLDGLDGDSEITKCSGGGSTTTRTHPIRAFGVGRDAVPMSPSCMQPQELAAQVLFAEQEVGRLQVELQAAHKHGMHLQAELALTQDELVVRRPLGLDVGPIVGNTSHYGWLIFGRASQAYHPSHSYWARPNIGNA